MPEYLAPGVFVEETSFRSKSIEGVSTTTTGFIGPARYGPIDMDLELVTSVGEYERVYSNGQQLTFGTDTLHNFLWQGVNNFFAEGGKRLYVSRVFRKKGATPETSTYFGYEGNTEVAVNNEYADGHARYSLGGSGTNALFIRARYPGSAGNLQVRFTLRAGQNIFSIANGVPGLAGLNDRDLVLILGPGSPPASPPSFGSAVPYIARWRDDLGTWVFNGQANATRNLNSLQPGEEVHVVTVTLSTVLPDDPLTAQVWDGLAFDEDHTRSGAADSLQAIFGYDDAHPTLRRDKPIVIDAQDLDALGVFEAFIAEATSSPPSSVGLLQALESPKSSDLDRSVDILLAGGHDGARPTAAEYEGEAEQDSTKKTGLFHFQDLEDISIVAAPGSTFGGENGYSDDAQAIFNLLIDHCELMKYRVAVLDSADGQTITQVRQMRARIDSTRAAVYYPWVKVLDPITQELIMLPPSGFVTGIYARNDINRAVYKAPANEVVIEAQGLEVMINKAQQEVLNPEGVNAFRFFEGRGFRLWGARTASSDPEWKYVNVRRYFAYLERSIDKGTQWAVFEPNGDQLWANVRRTISDFLLNEWQMGALLGDKPEKAYFVKCDRTTMTQNDLDNGRLVCLIGVAPLKPAEFVIFRVGQWTGDRQ